MGLFYTGRGDRGTSDILGKKVDKGALEILAVGAVDEINSLLGLVRTRKLPRGHKEILREAQENLFIVQAHVGALMVRGHKPPRFSQEKVERAEALIDGFEAKVSPERGFIVPGSNEATAWLDYARTVARRAEVEMVKLNKKTKLEPALLAYLNRLSSLLYAMARHAAKTQKKAERHPTYK